MELILKKALRKAGSILMQNFEEFSAYTIKENQSSILTQSDLDSEKAIKEIVSNAFPFHNILGEESGFLNKNSEYTWVIDPLDGTSNFASGIPWFGVIICVLKNFTPEMAGCFLPVQNQLYFAEKGKGTWQNDKQVFVSSENILKHVLVAYSLDYTEVPGKTEREAAIIQTLVRNARNLRSTNSLIDLCYTADGKLGACANQTTKIWDIAGPGLLIEEAGGKISTIEGEKIDYTIDENNFDRNFTIVGANKMIHSLVINLINK